MYAVNFKWPIRNKYISLTAHFIFCKHEKCGHPMCKYHCIINAILYTLLKHVRPQFKKNMVKNLKSSAYISIMLLLYKNMNMKLDQNYVRFCIRLS